MEFLKSNKEAPEFLKEVNRKFNLFKKRPVTPFVPNDNKQILHENLDFIAGEQYRILRTNLMFTLPADVKCPVIGITSSTRGEGKSTTAVNLAYVTAENNLKVLLIDADLRLPSIENKIGAKSEFGLTDMLINSECDVKKLKSSLSENLYVLNAGDTPPNPSELLGSRRMEKLINSLKKNFDCIIVDLPPVNLVTDAASISPYLTGMVVVVRENYVLKRELDNCLRQLKIAGADILGFVMNDVDTGKGGYKKYGYYKTI